MRATVTRLILVAPMEVDLQSFEAELRHMLKRYNVDWVVKETKVVNQPRSGREIAEYEGNQ